MNLILPITKSDLEELIQQSFENFGTIFSSNLIDSLKNIGFHYSTNSGISLSIEDLKIPTSKRYLLENVSMELKEVESAWTNGYISNGEKFKAVVNKWELTSEFLKDKLISYYKTYDPTNSLYLMAFSGARGNISQVRQIIGMRGLMVNQKGSIIQLPILSNFKEGLSNIDYIISSYGARKGIIDTALRTADAGYLTRRLIFLTQEIIIRDIDCRSENSISINLLLNSFESLLGRSLVAIKLQKNFKFFCNLVINPKILNLLKNYKHSIDSIQIRSTLTCSIPNSLCQYCYGWDLSKKNLITLGNTVGIIAAHSIGEPGTQLTMRTFHTGGIFIGQTKFFFSSDFSGKIYFPLNQKMVKYHSRYGINNYLLNSNSYYSFINWKNQKSIIYLKKGDFLYKPSVNFIKKGDIISERNIGLLNFYTFTESFLKPIYNSFEATYKFSKNLKIFSLLSAKNYLISSKKTSGNFQKYWAHYLVSSEGLIHQHLGKIFEFPYETDIEFNRKKKLPKFFQKENYFYSKNNFLKHKSIGKLKIIAPTNGIYSFKKNSFFINSKQKFSLLNLKNILKKHFFINLVQIFSNYQYLDRNTVIGFFYIFPKTNELYFKNT